MVVGNDIKIMTAQVTMATVAKNEIPVTVTEPGHIEVECPNGWVDVCKLLGKVLRLDGQSFRWVGWNSDRNVSFFRVVVG